MLARMAADVDRWSNGRLILGIGTGWATEEFAQLSIPFPSTPERQQALEEAVQVVVGLWGGERPLSPFRVSTIKCRRLMCGLAQYNSPMFLF